MPRPKKKTGKPKIRGLIGELAKPGSDRGLSRDDLNKALVRAGRNKLRSNVLKMDWKDVDWMTIGARYEARSFHGGPATDVRYTIGGRFRLATQPSARFPMASDWILERVGRIGKATELDVKIRRYAPTDPEVLALRQPVEVLSLQSFLRRFWLLDVVRQEKKAEPAEQVFSSDGRWRNLSPSEVAALPGLVCLGRRAPFAEGLGKRFKHKRSGPTSEGIVLKQVGQYDGAPIQVICEGAHGSLRFDVAAFVHNYEMVAEQDKPAGELPVVRVFNLHCAKKYRGGWYGVSGRKEPFSASALAGKGVVVREQTHGIAPRGTVYRFVGTDGFQSVLLERGSAHVWVNAQNFESCFAVVTEFSGPARWAVNQGSSTSLDSTLFSDYPSLEEIRDANGEQAPQGAPPALDEAKLLTRLSKVESELHNMNKRVAQLELESNQIRSGLRVAVRCIGVGEQVYGPGEPWQRG